MYELPLQDAEDVGGGIPWLAGWALSQGFTAIIGRIGQAVLAGEVDYSSLAESQGSYYNVVGA